MSIALKHEMRTDLTVIVGALLFSFGFNIFIVPLGMYSGGLIGVAQILIALLETNTSIALPTGINITGIINFALNIPLFVLAYKSISKKFFGRTLLCVAVQTIMMTFIAIPQTPIITDTLAACLIGGICCGVGIGFTLRAQACSGGIDILGVYMSMKKPGYSVGKLGIIINAFVFGICAVLFDIQVAIYSIIYTVCMSFTMDKIHYQNINMYVMIFSKVPEVKIQIMEQMRRGVTYWKGAGAFTNEETTVLITVISKYEEQQLKKIVKTYDPNAFVIFNEGMSISGNFEKRL